MEKKAVFTVRDRGEGKKSFWCRIGTCFTNRDGSFTVVLDALPIDGKLVIREEQQREERDEPRRARRPAGDAHSFGDDDGGIPF